MGKTLKDKIADYKHTNGSFEEVFSGVYSLPVTGFSPRTILDIGANEGAFTAWAADQWPDAKILAFEPVPQNFELFKQNNGHNRNVEVAPLAVSNSKNLTMHMGLNNSGECSAYDLGEQSPETVTVNCIAPHEIVGSFEFVKVDTEGCEIEIITGLDLSATKVLMCEYHRAEDAEKIKEIVEASGLMLASHAKYNHATGMLKFASLEFPLVKSGGGLKGKKLFVALPIYRTVDVHTVKSLIDLVVQQMHHGRFDMMMDTHAGECPIGRCRNDLTHTFLKSDCTHILFVDSDIKFTYEQVEKMLSHDVDIVGGFYTIKQDGPVRLCCNTLNTVSKPNEDNLVQMKYMGTGFLMVTRRVFEVMAQEMGESLSYIDDTDHKTVKHDFWRMGVATDPATGKRRWLSEDWQFCQFAIDLGFSIWADAAILLEHCGTAIYPLQSQLTQIYSSEQLGRITEQWKKDSASAGGAAEAVSPAVEAAPDFEGVV